jgi:hypothetical protein
VGSLFYLGYSLLFMAGNRSLAILLGYLDSSSRVRGYFLSSIGYSDVVIAWACYTAVWEYNRPIYIVGIVPVSAFVMALVLLNLALLFTSVVNRPLVCYIALFTGASLGFGFNLLPTQYWVFMFILDILLVLVWSSVAFPISPQIEGDDVDFNADEALEEALRLSRDSMDAGGGGGAADGARNETAANDGYVSDRSSGRGNSRSGSPGILGEENV